MQRPHVVQPVRELDNQHSDVPAHRDDHLADRLGLGRFSVLDLVQLRATVDEQCDFLAEVLGQLSKCVVGIFHRVVEQCCAQRRLCHAQLGEDGGDGERMSDECIATLAHLSVVQPLSFPVRALHQPEVSLRVIVTNDSEERI
jgi:hypothetical protein